jgi:hypothetical protein
MNSSYLKATARRGLVAMAIAAVGLSAAPSAAAQAAAVPATAGGSHCVGFLTTPGSTTPAPQPECFDTFAKALERASGGQLTEGPKNAADAMADPAFNAQVDTANATAERARAGGGFAAATVRTVVSIDYSGSSYGGSDYIWSGTNGNCSTRTTDTDYILVSMPAGWDNVVSSYRAYANCWVRHWENTSWTGSSYGYYGSRSSLGAMDNETSSEEWS